MKNQDFKNLFFKYEKKPLLGKKNQNFFILLGLFSLTLITMGFTSGSLDYLQKKMRSPFVLWLTVPIPGGNSEKGAQLIKALDKNELKTEYDFNTITTYKKYGIRILGNQYSSDPEVRSLLKYEAGRTIELDDLVLEELFKSSNKIAGRKFRTNNEIGIIASERLMEEYSYTNSGFLKDNKFSSHIWIDQYVNDSTSMPLPLPVIGVVKDLPDASLFAFTPFFYSQITKGGVENYFNPFSPNNESNFRELEVFVGTTEVNETKILETEIQKIVAANSKYDDAYLTAVTDTNSLVAGTRFIINPSPEFDSYLEIEELYKEINSKLKDKNLIRVYTHNFPYQQNESIRADFLSVSLNSLDKIRELRNYLLVNQNLEIDISKIEALENYNFISKLTIIISVILLVFSTIAIILFVNNLLSSYLDSIKSNLGTLFAFGLSSNYLQNVYTSLTFRFILLIFFISLLFSVVFGYLLRGGRLLLRLMSGTPESDFLYFNLLDWRTWLAVLLILTIIFFSTRRTLKNSLNHTPGDLIYNRV